MTRQILRKNSVSSIETIKELERIFIVSANYAESILLKLSSKTEKIPYEKLRVNKAILTVALLEVTSLARSYRYVTKKDGLFPDYSRFRERAIKGLEKTEDELSRM